MATKETKEKILSSAVKLFNKDGFINVRMQHICDDSIISLGNITYHYRTKDSIIFDIWNRIQTEQKELMLEYKILPLFEDFDRYIEAQFNLLSKNLFFYLDTLEIFRAYPEIGNEHRQHILWQEQQLSLMLRFNESRGALIKTEQGVYEQLASIWLWLSENWHSRQKILKGNLLNFSDFQAHLWSLLLPFMSEQGKIEYQQIKNLKKMGNYGSQFFH